MENEVMDKKLKEMHFEAINKQFEAAGFPPDMIKRFLKEFVPDQGERAAWFFETSIHETRVRGKVHAGPNVPGGFYTLDFYELTMAKHRAREKRSPAKTSAPAAPARAPQPAPVSTNKFVCTPWSWIKLDEAVNLMHGRYVYRDAEADPVGEGYWLYLTAEEPVAGFHRLGFIRTRFDVGNFLTETRLGAWLGLQGWARLVNNLQRGDRCELVIGTGTGMRALKIEADPRDHRLLLFDLAGHELDVVKVMKCKRPNPTSRHAPQPELVPDTYAASRQ